MRCWTWPLEQRSSCATSLMVRRRNESSSDSGAAGKISCALNTFIGCLLSPHALPPAVAGDRHCHMRNLLFAGHRDENHPDAENHHRPEPDNNGPHGFHQCCLGIITFPPGQVPSCHSAATWLAPNGVTIRSLIAQPLLSAPIEIGRASCRERVQIS